MKQDWTVNQKTGRANSSETFTDLVRVVESIIRMSGSDLIHGRAGTVARVIVAKLAHEQGLIPTVQTDDANNWTVDPSKGTVNSSAAFTALVEVVEHIILDSGFDLMNGRPETVARVIMAKLAHEQGLAPKWRQAAASASQNRQLLTKRGRVVVIMFVLTLLGILVMYFLEGKYDLPKLVIVIPALIPFVIWRLLLADTSWRDLFPPRSFN